MICSVEGCGKKTRTKKALRCETCQKRNWRKNNPLLSTYSDLKCNARKRGIEFGLTLDEWRKFCDDYNYLELRGKGPLDLTVDRKDSTIGYFYFNMQVLTHIENDQKGYQDKLHRKRIQDEVWAEHYRRKGGCLPIPEPKDPLNPEITPF